MRNEGAGPGEVPGRSAEGDEVLARPGQAGTDQVLPLTFHRRDGRWSILLPEAAELAERVRALRAAARRLPPAPIWRCAARATCS
jgi:hypothetical protein